MWAATPAALFCGTNAPQGTQFRGDDTTEIAEQALVERRAKIDRVRKAGRAHHLTINFDTAGLNAMYT